MEERPSQIEAKSNTQRGPQVSKKTGKTIKKETKPPSESELQKPEESPESSLLLGPVFKPKKYNFL